MELVGRISGEPNFVGLKQLQIVGRAFGYGLNALAAACGFSAIPRILSGQFSLELRALRGFNGVENRCRESTCLVSRRSDSVISPKSH